MICLGLARQRLALGLDHGLTCPDLGLDSGLHSNDLILSFDLRYNDIVPPLLNLKPVSLNIYLSDRSQTLALACKSPFCLNEAIQPPSVHLVPLQLRQESRYWSVVAADTCNCKRHLLKAVKMYNTSHVFLSPRTVQTHVRKHTHTHRGPLIHVPYWCCEIHLSSGTWSIGVCDLQPLD